MRRTSLSIAAGLTTAVLLVSGTPAQAAVSAKDLPKKGDIVKAFPEMADAEFSSFTTKKNSAPGHLRHLEVLLRGGQAPHQHPRRLVHQRVLRAAPLSSSTRPRPRSRRT